MKNDYEKFVERMRTGLEYLNDYLNINRCKRNIRQFVREDAWDCLQDMINAYWPQIEASAEFSNGTLFVRRNVDFNTESDESILIQLIYIARHIPIYVLLRQGNREMASLIFKDLDGS